jgi:hypothetical protein
MQSLSKAKNYENAVQRISSLEKNIETEQTINSQQLQSISDLNNQISKYRQKTIYKTGK